MDLLNRAMTQIVDWYKASTPGGRLAAAVAILGAVLAIAYLAANGRTEPTVDLMHGVPLSAAQLPLMEAALAKANLKGHEIHGTTIRVPRGQEAVYMAALADAKALPPNIGDALSAAISSGNAFESSRQREERMRIARQAELSLIIQSMNGIEKAYVLYDVDTKVGPFNREKLVTATASVKPVGSSQLDESRVWAIRHLVAGAIAGLKPENVTVSDLNGRTWHGQFGAGGGGDENLFLALERTYEQDLKAKILGALSFIPNVTVELAVEFARRPSPAAEQGRQLPAEADGSSTAQPNAAAALKVGELTDDGKTNADGRRFDLTPVSARVSIGVPMSYFKRVWQERNPSPSGGRPREPELVELEEVRIAESAKIQRHVAQLLPSVDGAVNTADLVAVTTFQDVPLQLPLEPPASSYSWNWLQESWGLWSVVVGSLAALLLFRRLALRRVVETNREVSAATSDELSDTAHAMPPQPHAQRFRESKFAVRDDLAQLVAEDPDAAANVLRAWIGQTN